MKTLLLTCAALTLGISGVEAGSRSSADYSITTDTIDAAGANASSVDYALYGSAVGEFGADAGALVTGTDNLEKVGYVGQVSDLLVLTASNSRKTHGGGAGTFDVNLPLVGPIGIECRVAGTGGTHQIIATFAQTVTVAGASVSGGGTIPPGGATSLGNQVTINLSGVGNPARLFVNLSGVSNGFDVSDISIPVGLLLGDVNGNGSVNSSDIGGTKAQSGQPATAANFRTDANVNGTITASDIGLVKSVSGTSLP